jgi:hypothetical protein
MTFTRLLGALLRWLVIGAATLVSIGFLVGFFARFGDGPIGPLPGGRLHDGEMVDSVGVDWSFVDGVQEIELQLLHPERSRTTWVVVHGGDLYVPCGYLQVPFFKHWHLDALRDGRAVVRIRGRRYPVTLVKVEDPTIYARVAQRLARKYGTPEYDPETAWIFRLYPRQQ